MGYTTEFEGHFITDRPVDEETYDLLRGLATTRRMKRDIGAEYGTEGEFYIDGTGYRGQGRDGNIIDYNRPPSTQPGLWCQWLIQEDRQTIQWDGIEKFYNYVEWLEYIIERVLYPRGYSLSGKVRWQGERPTDAGTITAHGDCVSAITDTEARWQSATNIRWDIMRMQRRADELYDSLSKAGSDALAGRDGHRLEWEEWQELLGSLSGLEMAYDGLVPDGMEDSIQEWYMSEYPEDSSSARIKEGVTFADLDDIIDTGGSFESVLGKDNGYFGPPVTRRCMTRLADMWGITYDDLYGKWITRL